MFKILLINDNYLETLLKYEDFFNKTTLFGYYCTRPYLFRSKTQILLINIFKSLFQFLHNVL